MTEQGAERVIVTSALITAAAYAVRRTHEQTKPGFSAARAAGLGPPLPLGAFVTAWGITFIGVSVLEAIDPTFGASFAMLIAAAVFLGNLQPALSELGQSAAEQTAADQRQRAAQGQAAAAATSAQAGRTAARIGGF